MHRPTSPASSISSASSASSVPLSPFSPALSEKEFPNSAATSLTDAPSAEHFLIPHVSVKSKDELISQLKDLVPVKRGTGQLVAIVLSVEEDVVAKRLRESVEVREKEDLKDGLLKKVGEVMGDEKMFDVKYCVAVPGAADDDLQLYKWPEFRTYEASDDEKNAIIEDMHRTSPMKLTPAGALNIFSSASLRTVYSTPIPTTKNWLYILDRPPITFTPLLPLPSSSTNVRLFPSVQNTNPYGPPTREEWLELWRAWDTVTLGMIPKEMLHQKPIDLRHKCLFYIGHIPTFVDILLSNLLNEPHTDPWEYTQIFERGIDPHVDDPDHCHNHSVVPEADEDWPILEDILAFRDRVRARLMRLYDDIDSGKRVMNRRIARVLQMTLEHEGFHVETLLYMLIQRAGSGTLPPPGFTLPPWSALQSQWSANPSPTTTWVTLGPTHVTLGHPDAESDDFDPEVTHDVYPHEFGWDNESPERLVEVGKFRIDWRPVTNGQFYEFWRGEGEGKVEMPRSWVVRDGEIYVLALQEPVPLAIAKQWPVLTSYDDMVVYAHSKGGRIPTEHELRVFLDKYQVGYEEGANVGFRNWHPVPATAGIAELGGRGSNGGIWEWTSTLFDTHPGLAPTTIFPGYSTDFFDGKHQVVIGASYATIPRLGRRTVRNFYQHNYPYPWVGARVAYDC